MGILNEGKPIGKSLHDFVHTIVYDMRKINFHLTIPVCRRVAKKIVGLYIKSFGVIDNTGKVIDRDAVALTTSLINHNNYVNAREKITLIPR